MIPPREKVLVAIPTFDRRIDVGTMAGLSQVPDYYDRPFVLAGMSDIGLARNNIAHEFVENLVQYDWIMWIDSDICFTREDWEFLWEGDEDVVCAQYARKILGMQPANFGLGFTRVHRSVFEKIKDLMRDDGTESAQRFYANGAMRINYFPTGATGDHRWISEDRGFFLLATSAGCKAREETRTKLRHVGLIEFHYPDQIPHWGPRTNGCAADED
jgi:hypothetical protein